MKLRTILIIFLSGLMKDSAVRFKSQSEEFMWFVCSEARRHVQDNSDLCRYNTDVSYILLHIRAKFILQT